MRKATTAAVIVIATLASGTALADGHVGDGFNNGHVGLGYSGSSTNAGGAWTDRTSAFNGLRDRLANFFESIGFGHMTEAQRQQGQSLMDRSDAIGGGYGPHSDNSKGGHDGSGRNDKFAPGPLFERSYDAVNSVFLLDPGEPILPADIQVAGADEDADNGRGRSGHAVGGGGPERRDFSVSPGIDWSDDRASDYWSGAREQTTHEIQGRHPRQ